MYQFRGTCSYDEKSAALAGSEGIQLSDILTLTYRPKMAR